MRLAWLVRWTKAPEAVQDRIMPLLTVRHISTYKYRQPVAFGEHRVMFRPRDSYDQRLLHASIDIDPEPVSLHWTHDVFGNNVACACFAAAEKGGRARILQFDTVIQLAHSRLGLPDFRLAERAEYYPFSYDQEDMPDLLRSIERQYPDRGNEIAAWAQSFVLRPGRTPTLDLLARITHAIRRDFTYVRREEMGIQPPLQTLKLRSGSCRDFALFMMEAVRALGFAARFVSGYLFSPARQPPAESATAGAMQAAIDQDERTGGGSTHAWMQAYLPGAGWMEFDPTNGIVGNHDLIRVAIARDPAQAVPLWGSWMGFPSDSLGLSVDVQVTSAPLPGEGPAQLYPLPDDLAGSPVGRRSGSVSAAP